MNPRRLAHAGGRGAPYGRAHDDPPSTHHATRYSSSCSTCDTPLPQGMARCARCDAWLRIRRHHVAMRDALSQIEADLR